MSLMDIASNESYWRGVDYCDSKKVIDWKKTEQQIYEGHVLGSGNNAYAVRVDAVHPRRSTCTCPFATGRRVVCKHMIALYYTAEPKIRAEYEKHLQECWEEEEEREEEEWKEFQAETWKYVKSLTKAELQQQLYQRLIEEKEANNRKYWY